MWRLCNLHDATVDDLCRAVTATALNRDIPAVLFEHHALGGRDALHAVLTPDRAFDGIPGLERIDPTNALTRLTS